MTPQNGDALGIKRGRFLALVVIECFLVLGAYAEQPGIGAAVKQAGQTDKPQSLEPPIIFEDSVIQSGSFTAEGREAHHVMKDIAQANLDDLDATIEQGSNPLEPTLGPLRLSIITSLAEGSSNSDVVTASSLFSLGHYFADSVSIASVDSLIIDRILEIRVSNNISLNVGGGWLWRDSEDNGLYGNSNIFAAGALGSDDRLLGSELSIVLEWKINGNLSVMTGYSHFFAASVLDAAGLGEDIDFIGVSAIFRF